MLTLFGMPWWVMPTTITVPLLLWAMFWPSEDDGWLGGLDVLIRMVPTLATIAVIWCVVAFLK